MSNSYFANRKSKSKAKLNPMVRNIALISIAVGLFIFGAIYSTRVIQNTLVVKASSIYEENFETPMSSIENLTGDGKIGGFYDVWIRFKCATGATLKDQSKYESKRASQALHWF